MNVEQFKQELWQRGVEFGERILTGNGLLSEMVKILVNAQ